MSLPDELSDDERAFLSLLGVIRFDRTAVANVLRKRPLSNLEGLALANLIEGKQPQGLRFEIHGQGKGWRPLAETASAYDRLVSIGERIDKGIVAGQKTEEVVNDLAEESGLSNPTLYRDLRLYRLLLEASD